MGYIDVCFTITSFGIADFEMNHHRWTIIDKNGRRNKLGIMHGPRTGNVMVYYNKKVLMVDFLVFGAKTFSFFLDEELYEIGIAQKGRGYTYSVRQNLEVNTPSNQSIKRSERNNRRVAIVFFSLFFVALGAALWWHIQYREKLLVEKGKDAFAQLVVEQREDHQLIHYRFNIGYDFYHSPKKEYAKYAISPNGFPFRDGDEVKVRFYPDNPSLHRLDYFSISKRQIVRYIDRAMQVHIGLHDVNDEVAICQLEFAYQLKGVEGLSLFYNQQLSSKENKQFNKQAFLRFTRDVPYARASRACN